MSDLPGKCIWSAEESGTVGRTIVAADMHIELRDHAAKHGRTAANLYAPSDASALASSDVLPAMMHETPDARFANDDKLSAANGKMPLHEILHADDRVDPAVSLARLRRTDDFVTISSREKVSIGGLTPLQTTATGFEDQLSFDADRLQYMASKKADTAEFTSVCRGSSVPVDPGAANAHHCFLNNGADACRGAAVG